MKMMGPSRNAEVFVCPKTGKVIGRQGKRRWAAWLLPAAGLISLAWFLVRVIPKPSRATYPCQRMALPIASGFVVWLVGLVTMVVAFRKAKEFGRQHRALVAVACMVVAVLAGLHTLFNVPAEPASAYTVPQTANTPVGVAKGICPGRVVLVHDPKAVNQAFKGEYQSDGHWWEARHNNQPAVDNIVSLAIRTVAGAGTDEAAWDAIFRYYNNTHGRGNVGYTAGEKINIKVNMVASAHNDGRVNLTTYVQTAYVENVSVSPWMILAMLRQLVNKAGVPQECISVGDPICFFPKHFWDACHPEFPNVKYLDLLGLLGRTKVLYTTSHPLYWSKPGVNPTNQDRMPTALAEATYHINIANCKAHEGGGVTLCGKNYYGLREPSASGYYELHGDLPYSTLPMSRYRTLVDLMGHADTGGKAILWMHDGLWGGNDAGTRPTKWSIPPCNNSWPGLILASQDPIAVESVGVDVLKTQWVGWYPNTVLATDDYLHEAALADDPPSGTFYDPERDGVRLSGMGTHEHWNNNTARQYTRNLSPMGTGIELRWFDVGDAGDANRDKTVNALDLTAVVSAMGKTWDQAGFDQKADLDFNGRVDISDLLAVINKFGTIYP
jgi:hypothetical protein